MDEQVVTRTHASEVRLLICRLSNPYQDPSSSEPFLFLSETLNLFQNNRVFTFLSLQFKYSVHHCILFCLLAFPPHPFLYFFFISGYLLRTPDNSNFFSICLEGSSYRELSASYPDVSLSMKICAQRKAGRSLYPSHGPLRLIASRSPLPCEKRSA